MHWVKKALKVFGVLCAVFTVVLVIGYFYVINNAESLIKEFVNRQTNGKISVEMKKISFNITKLRLTLVEPHFSSNDTLANPTTFDIRINKVLFKINGLNSLLFKRKLLVDSIIFFHPDITLTKWKAMPREKFSLSAQMNNAYESLNKLIKELSVNYCQLEKGSFSLVDKLHPEQKPVTITNFSLQVDNLQIDATSKNDKRAFLSDRIKFKSSHQDIVFPDGVHGLRYAKLRINSWKRRLELDSCYLYKKKAENGFNEFGIFFDTLRLTEVDFEALTRQGLIKADSVVCINPNIELRTVIKEKTNNKKKVMLAITRDTLEQSIKKLLGDFNFNYVGVTNAQISIVTKSGDVITPYSVNKSDFSIEDIYIIDDPAIPVHIGAFDIAVNGYRSTTPDSAYAVTFDSIHLRGDLVKLSNFSIAPVSDNQNARERKEIRMHSLEIKDFSWLDLAVQRRIIASEVILEKPEIIITTDGNKTTKKTDPKQLYRSLKEFSKIVSVKDLSIADADVAFTSANKKDIDIKGVNSRVSIAELFHARDVNELAGSAKNFSFRSGVYKTPAGNISLSGGTYFEKERTLLIRSAIFEGKDGTISVEFTNLKAEQIRQIGNDEITAEKLGWETARIGVRKFNPKKQGKATDSSGRKAMKLSLDMLDGNNTSIDFFSDSLKASVLIDHLGTGRIDWDGMNKPVINGLNIQGRALNASNRKVSLSADQFQFSDGMASSIKGLKIISSGEKDTFSIQGPAIAFTTDLQSILDKHPALKDVSLVDPVISLPSGTKKTTTADSQKRLNLPEFSINSLKIINPKIRNIPVDDKMSIDIANRRSDWELNNLRSENNELKVGSVKAAVSGISLETKKIKLSIEEDLNLDLSALSYSPGTATAWSVKLDSLHTGSISVSTKNKDTITNRITIPSFGTGNLSMNSDVKKDLASIILYNGNMWLNCSNLSLSNTKSNIHLSGIRYNGTGQRLSVDSFAYRPVMDKETFMKTSTWQNDYMQVRSGRIAITGFSFERFFYDSVIDVHKIETNRVVLDVSRDKRIPFQYGIIKPTPTTIFEKINKKLQVDSIVLNDANITYSEFNEKTMIEGVIRLNRFNANITGIRNYDYGPTDSLRIFATTWLMDTSYVRFRLIESYSDSLHGFILAVRARPFSTTLLNPILAPFASVKIKSGWLDTIRMNAIGMKYAAHGKMKMYYSNLRIQYLNNGNEDQKTLKTRLLTFVANDLFLRRNNRRKIGEVYFERLQEKGFFNYWLKILISGVVSSTGLKSNKKLVRNYQLMVKKLRVPELREVNF